VSLPTTTLPAAARARHDALVGVRDHLTLMKPKVTGLLTAFGVVAAIVADAEVAPWRVALFALLGFMAAGGAAALNHLFDRDIDARMARTRSRPLPSGRMTPRAAARFAALLLGLSLPLAFLTLGPVVALLFAAGAAVYGGLYTLVLKRRTSQNIVIGGLAGSLGVLAGWAVADPGLALGAWGLALLVFLWTPPHFWGLAIARDADYRAAGVPMLPQARGIPHTAFAMSGYALLMLLVSLALVAVTALGSLFFVSALVLGVAFTALCLAFWRQPEHRLAMLVFKLSGAYLGLLLVAMWVDLLV
jgi:heme o synthase